MPNEGEVLRKKKEGEKLLYFYEYTFVNLHQMLSLAVKPFKRLITNSRSSAFTGGFRKLFS